MSAPAKQTARPAKSITAPATIADRSYRVEIVTKFTISVEENVYETNSARPKRPGSLRFANN